MGRGGVGGALPPGFLVSRTTFPSQFTMTFIVNLAFSTELKDDVLRSGVGRPWGAAGGGHGNPRLCRAFHCPPGGREAMPEAGRAHRLPANRLSWP